MTTSQLATFAGGCFWCMVKPFDEWPGVEKIEVGYTGGHKPHPTYEEVCAHQTGHTEAVQITYDETVISYTELLDIFFKSIDPTDPDGQFGDRGETYTTAVFYHTEDQKVTAEHYKAALEASGRYTNPIVVPIKPAQVFYKAEDYHQDYHKKNGLRYSLYYKGSGRKAFVERYGYKHHMDEATLRERLSDEAYRITQEQGTELPHVNAYNDHFEPGIYVDIVSGKPLFASTDKFESGCGWPAFSKPIQENAVYDKEDTTYGMHRIEIRSTSADSHLGHVFEDGPEEQGGLRYCINSAALRFIPEAEMDEEGYGAYKPYLERK